MDEPKVGREEVVGKAFDFQRLDGLFFFGLIFLLQRKNPQESIFRPF